MKTKEEITTIVNTAITDMQVAIHQKNTEAIIQAMNSVEHAPDIDLEIIDDALFDSWTETVLDAHDVINY